MGPGGFRGLQIRWAGLSRSVGGFDSLALPPASYSRRMRDPSILFEEDHRCRARIRLPERASEDAAAAILATVNRYGVPGSWRWCATSARNESISSRGHHLCHLQLDRAESLGTSWSDRRPQRDEVSVIVRRAQQHTRRPPRRDPGPNGVDRGGDLGSAVRKQVQAILWSLFNWTRDGELRGGPRQRRRGFSRSRSPPPAPSSPAAGESRIRRPSPHEWAVAGPWSGVSHVRPISKTSGSSPTSAAPRAG